MKNKLLFMMFTILGAHGIATATDMANSEYNFAVNELSKSSLNQAAIIGQYGTDHSAQIRQEAQNFYRLFLKKVEVIGRRLTNQEIITLLILISQAVRTMPVFRKVHMVIQR